jgi:hypothetical protein
METGKNKEENLLPQEDLPLENELLKLKLMAENGARFFSDEEISPELENIFLRQIAAFENAYGQTKPVKIYEFIGSPDFIKEENLDEEEIKVELLNILDLMQQNHINLDLPESYDARLIYSFVTTELFEVQIDDIRIPGMEQYFTYEEFHPDHKKEIMEIAISFLEQWIDMNFIRGEMELCDPVVLPDGQLIDRCVILEKFKQLFEAYHSFLHQEYVIRDVSFQWQNETRTGLGFAEGWIRYEAHTKENEILNFSGPFKLYCANDFGFWQVYYFVLPGFDW